MKGVMHFGQKAKLCLKYLGPYEILKRIREVFSMFRVSQLRRYLSDPSHVIPAESVAVEPNLTFEERSVRILDRHNRVEDKKSFL